MANSSNVDESTKTDWTIMLYIEADDTLANFAVESLKQLHKSASAAGKDGEASVVVAAHCAFPFDTSEAGSKKAEAPGKNTVDEYIFKAGSDEHPHSAQVRTLPKSLKISGAGTEQEAAIEQEMAKKPDNPKMTEKEALDEFLKDVYANRELNQSKHYALILWGHGPELLLQPLESNPNGDRNSLYLNPVQLREVLDGRTPPNGSSLDIVGFDSCSMSMLEMACQLKGVAKYILASQEDVPDSSFPYDNLVELFRKDGNKPLASLLEKGVEAYFRTYKDCICNKNTGMRPVTLSALNLEKCDALKKAVGDLACALLTAKDEAGLPDRLIKARKFSQDYAGGLYVDLARFCKNLSESYGRTETEIQKECGNVLTALTKGPSNFILENSEKSSGHGVSIYFPYLTEEQYAQVSEPLVKGGHLLNGAKGYSEMLNGAAAEYLMCARRNLILDTEGYYGCLELSNTGWYEFITDLWTQVLIRNLPAELDHHYSAQQSWMNVNRKIIGITNPCKS